MKKQVVSVDAGPYSINKNISVLYELQFGKDMIKPGDKIKFKGVRGVFQFVRLAHNSKIDSTWIDCWELSTRQIRSFHVEKLKTVIRPKRSYRKKIGA